MGKVGYRGIIIKLSTIGEISDKFTSVFTFVFVCHYERGRACYRAIIINLSTFGERFQSNLYLYFFLCQLLYLYDIIKREGLLSCDHHQLVHYWGEISRLPCEIYKRHV